VSEVLQELPTKKIKVEVEDEEYNAAETAVGSMKSPNTDTQTVASSSAILVDNVDICGSNTVRELSNVTVACETVTTSELPGVLKGDSRLESENKSDSNVNLVNSSKVVDDYVESQEISDNLVSNSDTTDVSDIEGKGDVSQEMETESEIVGNSPGKALVVEVMPGASVHVENTVAEETEKANVSQEIKEEIVEDLEDAQSQRALLVVAQPENFENFEDAASDDPALLFRFGV